jgi:F0F1-type ATP synthase delta subunit
VAHSGSSLQLPEGIVGLPVLVATPSDVGRLLRELDTLDNTMLQDNLSGKDAQVPKMTSLLDQTVKLNKLDLSKDDQRKLLLSFLTTVKKSAPVMHISFSADPNVPFMQKLLAWLRQEIHPLVLVNVGLQPNLGAGCVVRTTNKYFDLSLRKDFAKSKDILIGKLDEINGLTKIVAPEAVANPAVAAPELSRSPAPEAQQVHA